MKLMINLSDDVTDDDLQICVVAALLGISVICVRDRRYADQCQRACFGRDDREADDDPVDIPCTDEIVLDRLLRFAKENAKDRYADEIGGENDIIYPGKSHVF